MKTFFVMLCVFVVINGILRASIDDAKFAVISIALRHFDFVHGYFWS